MSDGVRRSDHPPGHPGGLGGPTPGVPAGAHDPRGPRRDLGELRGCLLYTSDAADERSSVDLGGRRLIKKKTTKTHKKTKNKNNEQLQQIE